MKLLRKFFKKIGPGFITGAADDDPSGIATYSIAGARFGLSMSWLTLFLLPAMISIQEMCGRLGLTTGRGLASIIGKFFSRRVMWFAVCLLVFANTINIGANLGIMASSLEMVLGLPFLFWLLVVAFVVILLEIFVPYKKYSEVLKWLSLVLLVYIVTGFMVKPDWAEVFRSTVVPKLSLEVGFIMTLVGFLGTTISPYLFFWQTSQEVEEEISNSKSQISDFGQRPVVTKQMISKMKIDTKIGMFFSNLMAFFVIVTTASTLHANGIFEIESAQQAANALRPFAGEFAYVLFAVGMIGIGLQSVPVLAGSVSYALSEALGWKEGLGKSLTKAKGFYFIIAVSTMIGVFMNMLGINTVQALYYAAIVNGVAAVPLIFIIIRLARDKRVVGEFITSKQSEVVAWVTFGFMVLAVLFMFWNWGK